MFILKYYSSGQVTRFFGIGRKTTAFSDTKAKVEQQFSFLSHHRPCSIRLRSCQAPTSHALPTMATPGADDDVRNSIGVSQETRKDVAVGGGVKSVPYESDVSEKKEMEFKGIWVMMNGVSGKMGAEVAAACLRRGFRIAPYAICGSGGVEVSVSDLEVRETGPTSTHKTHFIALPVYRFPTSLVVHRLLQDAVYYLLCVYIGN